MPRPLWKGAISFSMVSIPVKLYSATDEKDVHFNMLHRTDNARIKQRRFCSEEDIEVDSEDIVKGYEVSPGQYVIMEPEDLVKVPVATTQVIEITDFVSLSEIDPILYQKTYFLEPEEIGAKPFALLRKALKETQRVAIAKVSMRQKEQLCTLRLYEDTIALETMYYADEIRSTKDLPVPPADVEVSDKELRMAVSMVDMLTADFDLGQYRDNYREALLEVIRRKAEGQTIEMPEPITSTSSNVMEMMEASIQEIRKKKAAEAAKVSSDSQRKAG